MRKPILLTLVLAVAFAVLVQPCRGAVYNYMLGDDDGFGSGSPVVPGDDVYGWGPADGDGTDESIPSGTDHRDFVFTYDTFSSITACSLFVQYYDWPETRDGFLWIDRLLTSYMFPRAQVDQEAPWTVLGVTIDLMPYVNYLYDGEAVFNFIGEATDGYAVDYAILTIQGTLVPTVIPVPVDISPGKCPNLLNPTTKGMLAVAVLGTADLDVETIDPGTVLLAGVAPVDGGYDDVATPMPDGSPACACTRSRGDGYPDLVLKFSIADVVATLGPVSNGETLALTLTGNLDDGTVIEGLDCVVIAAKGKKK